MSAPCWGRLITYMIYAIAGSLESYSHFIKRFVVTAAYTKNIDNELYYDVEFINNDDLDKNDLLLSSLDETIKQGIVRANISNMSNVIRRFAELKTAINIIDLLNKNDIIVLDGSLQCTFTNEKKYMDKLYGKAEKNNVIRRHQCLINRI